MIQKREKIRRKIMNFALLEHKNKVLKFCQQRFDHDRRSLSLYLFVQGDSQRTCSKQLVDETDIHVLNPVRALAR